MSLEVTFIFFFLNYSLNVKFYKKYSLETEYAINTGLNLITYNIFSCYHTLSMLAKKVKFLKVSDEIFSRDQWTFFAIIHTLFFTTEKKSYFRYVGRINLLLLPFPFFSWALLLGVWCLYKVFYEKLLGPCSDSFFLLLSRNSINSFPNENKMTKIFSTTFCNDIFWINWL